VVAFDEEDFMARFPALALAACLVTSVSCGDKEDTGATPPVEYEGDEAGECEDDADNDMDGLFDCDDPDCFGASVCEEADTDTDSDADSDTDTDSDSDADSDTDSDADTDADTDVECVPCKGNYILYNGHDLAEAARCESISGNLNAYGLDWVTDLELPCLSTVAGELTISANESLVTLTGLSNLQLVGGLMFSDNPAITSFDGMAHLTSISGYLDIMDNDRLNSLDGLSGLTSVNYLYIYNNDALESIQGLSSLASVGTDGVVIAYNDRLCQADAEALIAGVEVAGSVSIYSNGEARTDCP